MRDFNPQTTWFLVADSARASVMSVHGSHGPAVPVFDYVFAAPARAHSMKALTDRAGRSFDSYGAGRHAYVPRTDWRTQIRQGFARDLAKRIEEGAVSGRFAKLVLVAPPKALGLIRDSLGKAGRRCLEKCIGKEMTHLGGVELGERLARLVRL